MVGTLKMARTAFIHIIFCCEFTVLRYAVCIASDASCSELQGTNNWGGNIFFPTIFRLVFFSSSVGDAIKLQCEKVKHIVK